MANSDLLLKDQNTTPVSFAPESSDQGTNTAGTVIKRTMFGSFDGAQVTIGAKADSAATSDTGTFSFISFVKRGLQNWTSFLALMGTSADTAYSGTGSPSVLAALKGVYAALVAALPAGTNVIGKIGVQANGVDVTSSAPFPVVTPDLRNSGVIAAATLNASYVVALNNSQGAVGFTVSGLTATGATLTAEASNDGGTTYNAVNMLVSGLSTLTQTITTDSQFKVNAGAHTHVRLRVSVIGSAGNIAVSYTATSGNPVVTLGSQLPTGTNNIGFVSTVPAPVTITQTLITLTANTSATLIAANSSRKSLRWMVTGAGSMTVAPGLVTVTAGQGMIYSVGAGTGQQGGSETFEGSSVPSGAFSAISAAGTTVTVWEAQ